MLLKIVLYCLEYSFKFYIKKTFFSWLFVLKVKIILQYKISQICIGNLLEIFTIHTAYFVCSQ